MAYFRSRPLGSRFGAILSDQSEPISSREELEERLRETEQKYAGQEEVPCPEHWGGYEVTPVSIEFWQGRENRLHDRLVYRRRNQQWEIVRLSP